MPRTIIIALIIGSISLALGCSGERTFKRLEQITDQGRWTIDDTLIRTYDVSLEQAYESAVTLFKDSGWQIKKRGSEVAEARVQGETIAGDFVRIEIWALKGEATAIGVRYSNEGDHVESAKILDKLEATLPGKRIIAN